MYTIKASLDCEAEDDKYDPTLEARGSRILEQVASLQAEAAKACDSKYILSEEEIASIDNEYHPSIAEWSVRIHATAEEGERLVAEAQALTQSEEATKPPPDAPKAPRGMLCSDHPFFQLVANHDHVQLCLNDKPNVLPLLKPGRCSRSRSPGEETGLRLTVENKSTTAVDIRRRMVVTTSADHTIRRVCPAAAFEIRRQIHHHVTTRRVTLNNTPSVVLLPRLHHSPGITRLGPCLAECPSTRWDLHR
jgi:hypothetical protein